MAGRNDTIGIGPFLPTDPSTLKGGDIFYIALGDGSKSIINHVPLLYNNGNNTYQRTEGAIGIMVGQPNGVTAYDVHYFRYYEKNGGCVFIPFYLDTSGKEQRVKIGTLDSFLNITFSSETGAYQQFYLNTIEQIFYINPIYDQRYNDFLITAGISYEIRSQVPYKAGTTTYAYNAAFSYLATAYSYSNYGTIASTDPNYSNYAGLPTSVNTNTGILITKPSFTFYPAKLYTNSGTSIMSVDPVYYRCPYAVKDGTDSSQSYYKNFCTNWTSKQGFTRIFDRTLANGKLFDFASSNSYCGSSTINDLLGQTRTTTAVYGKTSSSTMGYCTWDATNNKFIQTSEPNCNNVNNICTADGLATCGNTKATTLCQPYCDCDDCNCGNGSDGKNNNCPSSLDNCTDNQSASLCAKYSTNSIPTWVGLVIALLVVFLLISVSGLGYFFFTSDPNPTTENDVTSNQISGNYL
jgi:hypothetical protein